MFPIFREAKLIRQLRLKYGVRFLPPKQVIRRAMRDGLNPFYL